MLIIDTISVRVVILVHYQGFTLDFDDIIAGKGKLISLLNRLLFTTFLFFPPVSFNSLQRHFSKYICEIFYLYVSGGALTPFFCPSERVFVHSDCPEKKGFAPFESCPMKLIAALFADPHAFSSAEAMTFEIFGWSLNKGNHNIQMNRSLCRGGAGR